ncbi:LamG domain-containing protein [Sandaracinobacteroides saxicola]|uniref:LamG domain-containing protein n=1 Tax=Sandaracinobacteroides saxicola TaxID=2759707 RepID=UPI001A9C2A6E|nr:LamG domain-containing protein [Sandaracinobacteroides saxicola]
MSQAPILRAHWGFDAGLVGQSLDSATNTCDVFHGHWEFLPGVNGGRGLRFDGFTTFIDRPAGTPLKLGRAATVEAWVTLGAFPWNEAPILDAEALTLGIDDHGRAFARARFGDVFVEARSETSLGLRSWHHVAVTADDGLALYLDGKAVAHAAAPAAFVEADAPHLYIGRSRGKAQATGGIRLASHAATDIYLDGILDEIKLYAGALPAGQIAAQVAATTLPDNVALPERRFPTEGTGPGRFGAFYTYLRYYDAWDRRWRVGDHPDVVVRFEHEAYRLVFWRGTNYVPCWATAEGIWYTNEFNETWGNGIIGCGEPMSDKHCAYSHVRIIESSAARVVVHWRYALVDVYGNRPRRDPVSGWTDFSDEVYTIYPDGTGTRKITLHSTQPLEAHEFQETMVVLQPGQTPEDVWDARAITMANMAGEEVTYDWSHGAPTAIVKPDFANIELVNLKTTTKPFLIVSPGKCLTRRQTLSDRPVFPVYAHEIQPPRLFPWWNHWPTAEIPSDGRHAVAADRASHASVSSGMEWADHEVTATSRTRVMLHGLTRRGATELVPLAKSWLQPPPLTVTGGVARNAGYDVTERAYRLTMRDPSQPLLLRIDASEGAPLVNLCLVIENWGDGGARVSIDGAAHPARIGVRDRIEGRDLIVWLELGRDAPVAITLSKDIA